MVTSKTKTVIPFDVCVVAVGQKIPIFLPSLDEASRDVRVENIKALHEKVRQLFFLFFSNIILTLKNVSYNR